MGLLSPEGIREEGGNVLSPEVGFLSLEGCGLSLQMSGGKG